MALRVEIGDLDGPIGIVSVQGKRLRYDVSLEQRSYLHGIVASCREGIDHTSGVRYADMEPEQFLQALERRLHGWTWASIVPEPEPPKRGKPFEDVLQEEMDRDPEFAKAYRDLLEQEASSSTEPQP